MKNKYALIIQAKNSLIIRIINCALTRHNSYIRIWLFGMKILRILAYCLGDIQQKKACAHSNDLSPLNDQLLHRIEKIMTTRNANDHYSMHIVESIIRKFVDCNLELEDFSTHLTQRDVWALIALRFNPFYINIHEFESDGF